MWRTNTDFTKVVYGEEVNRVQNLAAEFIAFQCTYFRRHDVYDWEGEGDSCKKWIAANLNGKLEDLLFLEILLLTDKRLNKACSLNPWRGHVTEIMKSSSAKIKRLNKLERPFLSSKDSAGVWQRGQTHISNCTEMRRRRPFSTATRGFTRKARPPICCNGTQAHMCRNIGHAFPIWADTADAAKRGTL
ncbi:hypothetical protein CEXT_421351 [Caerostris extrusa]|uniref:Uncharacterized protein n=1 Tax=Caerostris extrusa TaxID=172846 RepID=A0AAV4W4T2_CAEEX|nr:hypothetical protein CEXT_421351 [Caerostris extrusa]